MSGLDYRTAGVDLERAARDKAGLEGLLSSTSDDRTLSALGHFGGLYAVPGEVPDPVLVSSADGVGTKLKVAFLTNTHDTVGQDIVNHCVNDILVQGARPLFFLDYLACGELAEGVVSDVVGGVATACRENGCVLLGGETAQMPEFYPAGEYDLAGFVVGIVARSRVLDGSAVEKGDALIGLPASGLHTNGYTLARRVLMGAAGLDVTDPFPGTEESVGAVLLRIHRSYLPVLAPELDRGSVRGLAHITGGGLPGNLPRVLPKSLGAEIRRDSWAIPETFQTLQRLGSVEDAEMFRVFNMGVGMVVILGADEVAGALDRFTAAGEAAWLLGEVVEGEGVRFV